MSLTLNQVVKNLSNIASAHNQLKHFYFGELYDFAASGTTEYPAMVVSLEPTPFQTNVLTYSFNVYIIDLVHKGISNSTEVLSDTLQTCTDITSIVANPIYAWNSERTNVFNDIQGGLDDGEYGFWFNLKLKVPRPIDRCQVPLLGVIDVIVPAEDIDANYLLDEEGNIIQTNDGFNIIAD